MKIKENPKEARNKEAASNKQKKARMQGQIKSMN